MFENLPVFLQPVNARYTIPLILAVAYAVYHAWRWRMMHPKIVIEELPKPAAVAETVARPTESKSDDSASPAAGVAGKTSTGQAANARPYRLPRVRVTHAPAWNPEAAAAEEFARAAHDPNTHEYAYNKAYSGRPEYFVRLGEYAWQRGAMVEAHFWVSMGRAYGVEGLDAWLSEIRRLWIGNGRPQEAQNVYDIFPYERSILAYNYLSMSCGFNTHVNRMFIERMAAAGDADAGRLLSMRR